MFSDRTLPSDQAGRKIDFVVPVLCLKLRVEIVLLCVTYFKLN
jgi:hypothetical protein